MKKSNTWIVWVLLSSCFLVYAETAYVQVVDEAGSSIPSAQVSAYWFERAFLSGKLVSKSGSFTCNTEGIAPIPLGGKMMVVPNVAGKEGYVFERYLNMNMDFLSGTTDTKGNPRRMILRKPEPASFLLEVRSDVMREAKGGSFRFGVDLFHAQRKSLKMDAYKDFFVSGRYLEDERRWETTFWTTNANCGLVATVNRRFAAPETGYVSRIEVPQEAFTNRAFTLYLKTRNPVVYAMIPFGLDDLESRSWVGLQGPRWRFHYDVARINPYGGREMEQDRRTGRIYSEIRNDALHAFLIDHRLAPKPDITARLYNDSKRKVLEDQRNLIGEEERALRRKMEELQEKQGHDHEVGQNLKVMQDELYRFLPRYRAIDKELKRLDEEAHTLNLPEEKRGNME